MSASRQIGSGHTPRYWGSDWVRKRGGREGDEYRVACAVVQQNAALVEEPTGCCAAVLHMKLPPQLGPV